MLAPVKRLLLPSAAAPRRIPVGLGRGLTMELDLQHELRLFLGIYEIELARAIRRLARPGVVAFDVGGQHGYDALVFAARTGAHVSSFECEADAVERMRRSFALNPRLAPQLRAVQATVGDGTHGTLALDAHDAEPPGLVKVDVEGAEVDVLRGATRIMRECRPAWIVEVHGRAEERECGALLVAHGYRPRIVDQRRVLPDRRPIPHNRWLVADAPGA